MRKYDAIIFDFDGVLVESVDVKTQAFAALYAKYGQEIVEKVIAYHLRHAGVSRFDKFRYFHEVLLGKRLSEEEEKMLCVQFSELVVDAVVAAPWVPGAKEFLERFYKEIPLFIASGTPDDEIKEIVNKRQMSHYFVSIHGTPAKKAEIINTIWNKFGFERKRMLMVGDAVADYEGVILTGICFIGRVQHLDKNAFPESVHVIKDLSMLHHYI
jgi:HAD superfamily hydrolase (TIGR01549 family)